MQVAGADAVLEEDGELADGGAFRGADRGFLELGVFLVHGFGCLAGDGVRYRRLAGLARRAGGGAALIIEGHTQGDGGDDLAILFELPGDDAGLLEADVLEIEDDVPGDEGDEGAGEDDIDRGLQRKGLEDFMPSAVHAADAEAVSASVLGGEHHANDE